MGTMAVQYRAEVAAITKKLGTYFLPSEERHQSRGYSFGTCYQHPAMFKGEPPHTHMQIKYAPENSVYVCRDNLDTRSFAEKAAKLGRLDLAVVALVNLRHYRKRRKKPIVVDERCVLVAWQLRMLELWADEGLHIYYADHQ